MSVDSLRMKADSLKFLIELYWMRRKDLTDQFHQKMNFFILAETLVIISFGIIFPTSEDRLKFIIPLIGSIISILWLVDVLNRYREELIINHDFIKSWTSMTSDAGEITDIPKGWKDFGISLIINLLLPIIFIVTMVFFSYYLF